MNIDKLLNAPLPTYDSSVPGSYLWTKIAFWMCRRVSSAQFRTTASSSTTELEVGGAGAMCCGWHTNGLMDPLGIFLNHPKEFVVGARHDWSPAPSGMVDATFGGSTGRSQSRTSSWRVHRRGSAPPQRALTSCAFKWHRPRLWLRLFPEGTSHSQSFMLRFKTGPVRTVLAAAALAKANGLPLPQLVPVGLHFRQREKFRTDQYIEFGDPINLTDDMIPPAMVNAVRDGGWVEPPMETVHQIRDQLQDRLPDMTPNTSTWEEHRALHLLAHAQARHKETIFPIGHLKCMLHERSEMNGRGVRRHSLQNR